MDSLIKFTPESLKNNDAFVDHLLSIIDTKLQFIEYRTSRIINDLVKEPNSLQQRLNNKLEINLDVVENEKIFDQIEEYSRTTSFLLLMRVKLCGKNASLVYDLLSDDKYLKFSDTELEKALENSLC